MSDSDNGQNITEEQTVAPVPSAEQPAEGGEEPTLPDGVKERTAEEFEKLKASNRALKEELSTLKGANPSPTSVLDELRPNAAAAGLPAAPLAGDQPLVDAGGYVDANLLNSRLTNSQQSAEEAKRIALQTQQEIQRFQETQVVQAVHKDFPEIDPNNQDEFNPEFYNFVKNELVGQIMQGKREDLRAAATMARKVLALKQVPAKSEPRKETISQRGQASVPTNTSHTTPPQANQQDLVEGTRKGDKDAIFKRLQASGY